MSKRMMEMMGGFGFVGANPHPSSTSTNAEYIANYQQAVREILDSPELCAQFRKELSSQRIKTSLGAQLTLQKFAEERMKHMRSGGSNRNLDEGEEDEEEQDNKAGEAIKPKSDDALDTSERSLDNLISFMMKSTSSIQLSRLGSSLTSSSQADCRRNSESGTRARSCSIPENTNERQLQKQDSQKQMRRWSTALTNSFTGLSEESASIPSRGNNGRRGSTDTSSSNKSRNKSIFMSEVNFTSTSDENGNKQGLGYRPKSKRRDKKLDPFDQHEQAFQNSRQNSLGGRRVSIEQPHPTMASSNPPLNPSNSTVVNANTSNIPFSETSTQASLNDNDETEYDSTTTATATARETSSHIRAAQSSSEEVDAGFPCTMESLLHSFMATNKPKEKEPEDATEDLSSPFVKVFIADMEQSIKDVGKKSSHAVPIRRSRSSVRRVKSTNDVSPSARTEISSPTDLDSSLKSSATSKTNSLGDSLLVEWGDVDDKSISSDDDVDTNDRYRRVHGRDSVDERAYFS